MEMHSVVHTTCACVCLCECVCFMCVCVYVCVHTCYTCVSCVKDLGLYDRPWFLSGLTIIPYEALSKNGQQLEDTIQGDIWSSRIAGTIYMLEVLRPGTQDAYTLALIALNVFI